MDLTKENLQKVAGKMLKASKTLIETPAGVSHDETMRQFSVARKLFNTAAGVYLGIQAQDEEQEGGDVCAHCGISMPSTPDWLKDGDDDDCSL